MKLQRPMSSVEAPKWLGAKWVGEIDYADFNDPAAAVLGGVYLEDAEGYNNASLLVRSGAQVMGFIDVPVFNSYILRENIAEAIAKLPEPVMPVVTAVTTPHITVAICTHNRADLLDGALASIMQLDYPNYDVLVVENAPRNDDTHKLVTEKYPQVTYAVEYVKGVSQARNKAIKLATGDIIAFTDDDVVVDRYWLQAFAAVFAEDANIGCVTGLVPSGEFISHTQAYFDNRVTWSHILEKSYYSLANPPTDIPAFPFAVGRYGTGANFAIRRDIIAKVGKFDTAFGAGVRTGGGEDIDFFTRVLFARQTLVVAPNAVVWHRHRSDDAALAVQAKAYGVGLGAWLTKLALSPRMWLPLLGKVRAGRAQLSQLGDMTAEGDVAVVTPEQYLPEHLERELQALERRAVILGPIRYFQQVVANICRPLSPRNLSSVYKRFPLLPVAMLIAAAQALLLIPGLPTGIRGLLVGLFAFTAPGMIACYKTRMPKRTRALLIAGLSVSLLLILTTLMAMAQVWYPLVSLLTLAGGVVLVGIIATLKEMWARP